MRTILCVPLKSKERILGVIYVDNRVMSGIFTQAELELLITIANHAALSIENTRLYYETQNNLYTLRLLYEITASLTSTLDLQSVLENCLSRVQQILGAEAASILTLEGDELVFQVALGEKSSQIKPMCLQLNQGIAGWVVQNRLGVIVNEPQQDARFFSQTDAETGFSTENLLAAPLLLNEKASGVIEVFNKPGGFTNVDLELLSTIASSASIAIENARLYQAAVEKGRMERELQVARNVQASLLPTHIPQVPGWEFAVRWLPARQVSGDYYDFIPLAEGRLGLVIADVTDKGMPAALFMAFARSIMRASMDGAVSPVDGIQKANRLICTDSSYGLFVTTFFASLDPLAHEMTCVNAGHNPPLIFHQETGSHEILNSTCLPLGIELDTLYIQHTVKFAPGDFIVLYTDGVTEAIDSEDRMFSLECLEELIHEQRSASANDLLEAIEQSVRGFLQGGPPTDDLTILVAKRLV